MANLVITVPDAAVQRVLDAVTGLARYTPVNQADAVRFTKQALADELVHRVRVWERRQQALAQDADPTDPLNGVTQT